MKAAIESDTSEEITVFKNLGNVVFLIELTSRAGVEMLIEEGFDVEEFHVSCHPPQGYYMNVSIMGLRSYVDNEEVVGSPAPYREIKGDVFWDISIKRIMHLRG